MMKHLRARPDFDSVADWYGLRWENMMENKYLFAWTGVGVYSGTDLGTSAVDVDVDTEPGPSGEAFDESAEPSPVEKVDAAADESAVYLEPLDLDGSRRLADAVDASSIDGTSFYVTPAMTPAASPAPKPPGSLHRTGSEDSGDEGAKSPRAPETNDAIRRLRDVAAAARGATETGGVSVTWSASKPVACRMISSSPGATNASANDSRATWRVSVKRISAFSANRRRWITTSFRPCWSATVTAGSSIVRAPVW